MNLYKSGILALAVSLAACSDDVNIVQQTQQDIYGNGSNVVTFVVRPQAQSVASRADSGSDLYTISDGSHVDILIFAVYEVNSDGTLTLAPQFKKENPSAPSFELGDGQSAVSFRPDERPTVIQLATDPHKTYCIAFWAQNSQSTAFDTHSLEHVQVLYRMVDPPAGTTYDELFGINNDELRDAFCTSITFSGNTKIQHDAVLHRPFAQINIGTTGWDYEGIAALKPSPTSYIQTKVTLKGVAQFYNVATGCAITKENGKSLLADVVFSYNIMPAFVHHYKNAYEALTDKDFGYKPLKNEEFLFVRRDKDALDKEKYEIPEYESRFAPYVSWEDYQTLRNKTFNYDGSHKIYFTETFKYLSMCYVLVPEPAVLTDDGGNTMYGSVLQSVAFEAQGIQKEEEVDENGQVTSVERIGGIGNVFEVTHVPVQKNWRTNILGESLFFLPSLFKVYVVPSYCGDYDHVGGTSGTWDPADGNDDWIYGTTNPDFDDPGKKEDGVGYHDTKK